MTAKGVVWYEVGRRLWVPIDHPVLTGSLFQGHQHSFTITYPGFSLVKVMWCRDLMPFKARCQNGWSKKVAQSYVGMITLPSWVPTSWVWLTAADDSTTRTMSSKHPILVRPYACFNRPKHQSGKNLVCPTMRKDRVMDLFRPDKTRHARYCMTYLFLFWPEQLSACRWRWASPKLCVARKWWSMLIMLLAPFPVFTASSIR